MGTDKIPDMIGAFMHSETQPDRQEGDGSPPESRNQRKRILIVDDEPMVVKILDARLPKKDYETLCAFNGKSALKIAKEEAPDLILLDVMMPDINGYEVTKRLKSEASTRNIPVILLTALDGPEEKTKGLKAGADDFLNKPIHFAELLARVRLLIRLKEYQEQFKNATISQVSSSETMMKVREDVEKKDFASILLVGGNSKDDGLIQHLRADQRCKIRRVLGWAEAISLMSREKSDLLILNVPLPGTDALEFCWRLEDLKKSEKIQILLLTNQEYLGVIVKMMEFGADDFIVKPVEKNEFKARIKILLNRNSPLPSPERRPPTGGKSSSRRS